MSSCLASPVAGPALCGTQGPWRRCAVGLGGSRPGSRLAPGFSSRVSDAALARFLTCPGRRLMVAGAAPSSHHHTNTHHHHHTHTHTYVGVGAQLPWPPPPAGLQRRTARGGRRCANAGVVLQACPIGAPEMRSGALHAVHTNRMFRSLPAARCRPHGWRAHPVHVGADWLRHQAADVTNTACHGGLPMCSKLRHDIMFLRSTRQLPTLACCSRMGFGAMYTVTYADQRKWPWQCAPCGGCRQALLALSPWRSAEETACDQMLINRVQRCASS